MAVPLIDKGVVVVAVGYAIAPKGRVFSFLFLCAYESFKEMSSKCQLSASLCSKVTWT